jgi:hypothetical protein
VIVRPTTAQLLRDVRRELSHAIAPEVTSATARVTLEQIDIILESCAVRAGAEIAWMVEEIAEIEAYATAVVETTGDVRTRDALDAARAAQSGSLELDALVVDYNAMSDALSCAIEACMAVGGPADLRSRGVGILRARRAERETVVRANWRLVGRG